MSDVQCRTSAASQPRTNSDDRCVSFLRFLQWPMTRCVILTAIGQSQHWKSSWFHDGLREEIEIVIIAWQSLSISIENKRSYDLWISIVPRGIFIASLLGALARPLLSWLYGQDMVRIWSGCMSVYLHCICYLAAFFSSMAAPRGLRHREEQYLDTCGPLQSK
jgi:hypothetical protein